MKKNSLIKFLRLLLLAGVLLGVVLLAFSFASYETLASVFNKFAADGKLDVFTQDVYEISSRFSSIAGPGLILLAGAALIWWTYTQQNADRLLSRWNNFKRLVRRDAPIFIKHFSPARMNRNDRWLLLGLMALAFLVRLANLFIPIDFDEAYTYNAFASGTLWHTVTDYHMPNNHVFLTIFLNIIVHTLGKQLWMMRLPSLIIGVLMIPVCYALARRWYGKEAAVLSALLVAVFPVLVKYSVLARGYITISLFTVLIFLLGDYVREHKNRLAWLLLIVCSALGLYTIPIMLYAFGALHVWFFLVALFGDFTSYRTRGDFIKYWLASGVTTTLLTTALYLPIFLNTSNPLAKNQFLTPVGWDLYPSVLWPRLQETWGTWTSQIPGWIVVIGVLGLFLSLVLHPQISRPRTPAQIAFLIWIVGFIAFRRPIMETRMWTFLAAPLLIWSAGGLMGALKLFSERFNRKWQLSPLSSNVILVFVIALSLLTIRTIPERWTEKSNIENTVLYLKSHLKEGDVIASSIGFRPQLQYYFVVYDIPSTYLRRTEKFQRAFVLVRSVEGSANAGDTLEKVAPRTAANVPAIDLATAKIVQQYEDLTVYESYPSP